MIVSCPAFAHGVIPDRFGKRSKDKLHGMPTRSFPVRIEQAPVETVSYALIFDDPDATPFCGFPWVHWTVANLTKPVIEEGGSRNNPDFIQGVNSWYEADGSQIPADYSCFGGPAPPKGTHNYRLRVWALDTTLELQPGFALAQLEHAIEGHILETAQLNARYSA